MTEKITNTHRLKKLPGDPTAVLPGYNEESSVPLPKPSFMMLPTGHRPVTMQPAEHGNCLLRGREGRKAGRERERGKDGGRESQSRGGLQF